MIKEGRIPVKGGKAPFVFKTLSRDRKSLSFSIQNFLSSFSQIIPFLFLIIILNVDEKNRS